MVRHFSIASLLLLLLTRGVSAQPRIEVHEGTTIPPGSTGIVDNTGSVEFGATKMATVLNRTFTVRNVGNQNLVLTEPISVPNGFTVMRTFGRTTVPPGQTTSFVVALNAAAAGRYQGGQISFATNDVAPRNIFNFTLTGSALPEAGLRVIDNSDSGFRLVGSWLTGQGSPDWGYQGNARYKLAGNGSAVASWTFKGLTPGLYQVSTSFSPYQAWAPDARFTLRPGDGTATTVTVDQRYEVADFRDAGLGWTNLSTPIMVMGDTLVVQLSDQATAGTYVIADAVRVDRVGYVGRMIDDGSPGFTTTGTWQRDLLRGFQTDALYKAPQTPGTSTATWSFSVPAGQYRVSATWREGPNRATNASYTIRNGATNLATVQVNQRQAPKDIVDGGTRWTDLGVVGTVYTNTGTNPLVVELNSAGANGLVVADAVRVERVNVPTQPTVPDVVRLLEQATWGPNSATIAQVRSMGIPAWVNAQFTAAYSGYPTRPVKHDDRNQPIGAQPYGGCRDVATGQNDPVCVREHYSPYLMQRGFFTNAFYGQDQLRQRMAWNLHKIIVTDARNIREYAARFTTYLQILDYYSFRDFKGLLYYMTLNPNMGHFLDMVLSNKTRPNENYARELLQLFSIGLDELHPDGTPILTAAGDRVPTYDQAKVEEFTRALTGWQRQPPFAAGTSNYIDFMDVIYNAQSQATQHDGSAKTLLLRSPVARTIAGVPGWNPATGQPLPDYDYAVASLNQVIDNVFNHPNLGPYICKQLIQMMVTSNPSPGYVARVSAVFDRNRAPALLPNQLREVARAILLDPEARGDIKVDPNYGRLREPVQLATNMCRAFGVTSYHDRAVQSDGVLGAEGSNQMGALDQDVFRPPSVFSYYMPDNIITGTNNVIGPEFQIYSTLSAVRRHNFLNLMLQPNNTGGNANTIPPTPAGEVYGIVPTNTGVDNRPVPTGTKLDLRALEGMATNSTQLVDEIDRVLFGTRMPATMRTQVLAAVNVVPSDTAINRLRRVKTALYIVLNAPEYMVQR